MRLRLSALTLALGTLAVALACSAEAPAPASTASAPAPAAQAAPPPAAQQGAAPSAAAAVPATVAEIFPPGPGRDTVLNGCASCHNLACSAIGQRPAARWDALKEAHKDRIPDADATAAFAYLKSHFNDANPEPKVPPQFLQGGCTPF